ncbi:YheC/YheD family protein [Paenibacillus puldeungensis]|uniref:YheC/YheD family protein n=1 Tax=Paenibacillus puldeungensis TaxID=696536 RepID=A0ABW3S2C7_9BACL
MRENYVGILLNSSMYRGIPQRKTGQESISNYEDAAREYGLIPCFLRLGDIVPKQEACTAYVWDGTDYRKMVIPVPSVIHNRALYPEAAAHRKIHSLISQGITVFNVNNRYGKDVIHRLLWNVPQLRGYLPVAAPVKPGTLRAMMSRYPDLILKPIRGSVGHGIMRLQYTDNCWELTYASTVEKKSWTTVKLRRGELPIWTRRRLQRTPYLVQERIPLAEYETRPLDLRVTVQRGLLGEWGVTGLFVKAAPQGGFVCNIAKGGDAHPAADLLAKVLPAHQVPAVITHVEALALAIARHLSSCLPLLADLGLDIGLTATGQPYFIECNGRDQRYGFRKAELTEIWRNTYRQPMAFARYLLEHPATQL